MSFSSDVKQELARLIPQEEHCRTAELSAVLLFAGEEAVGDGQICIQTEQVILARMYYTLIKKIFGFHAILNIRGNTGGRMHQYRLIVKNIKEVQQILEKVCYQHSEKLQSHILKYECCRRTFIRGAFLAAGSMSNPGKSYHLEIVCRRKGQADLLCRTIVEFHIPAKIIQRKSRYVVYIKESEGIADLLKLMGAGKASMELENVRIIKDMRNAANRQYNCDAANINKLVKAASRQVEDIRYLQQHMGLENLPKNLYETAAVRLEHPDVSLQELGSYMNPPVGKSGVNHRLRKLGEMARELQAKEKDKAGSGQ